MNLRVGTVAYSTEQGLGYLAKWFYDQGVITDVLLVKHPRHLHRPDWYPADTPIIDSKYIRATPDVMRFIQSIDTLLCFETPFDYNLVRLCKSDLVKTVLVPMYEWTLKKMPVQFDKIISPSLLDKQYFPESEFIPIPASPWIKWQQRTTAKRFLHNAGHVGHREHKGTRQLLESLKFSKTPFELTIRCQYQSMVEQMAESCGVNNDPRLTLFSGSLPYEQLWDGFDVLAAPEKFNGLSIPLAEAFAAGLAVCTTDRFPMNTWLPKRPLIPVERYERACINANYIEFDEAVVAPQSIAYTMDGLYGQDISDLSLAGKAWAEEHSWERLKPRWLEALT